MKTLIDVLAARSDFVKVASEWAESASKAEVETFTQIYPQKEEAVKKAVEKAVTLEEVRSVLANLSRSGQKETVQKLLGNLTSNPTENLDFYDTEMEDCTDSYAQYIAELLATLQEPIVLVEQRLDFSRYVPSGFGTGDCVIVADDILTVFDFKYGKGVAVSADHNSQMMLYALGALELFDALYDIAEIRMVIFQPRIQSLSEYIMPLSELLHWAETELKPKAALAARGEGEFSAGEHCRFCKRKATCRKRAEYNLQLAKYDFAMPDKLTDTEIETILATADQLTAWVADVKEYALRQALSGKQWHGYKVVAGKANRKYTNPAAVAAAVQAYGKNPYKEPELLGVTAMEQLLGRTQFETLLGSLTEKPQGKPTLVPYSDKRSEWSTAQEDFNE